MKNFLCILLFFSMLSHANHVSIVSEPTGTDYEEALRMLVSTSSLQGFKKLNLNMRGSSGGTVLHLVVKEGYLEFAKKLIEAGASKTIKDHEGYLPLHYAVQSQKKELIRLLVDEVTARAKDNQGETALDKAVKEGGLEIVEILIYSGADPSDQNKKGQTSLHHAVLLEQEHLIEYLMTQDAINKPDNQGQTPLQLATQIKNEEIIEILKQGGAKLNIKPHTKNKIQGLKKIIPSPQSKNPQTRNKRSGVIDKTLSKIFSPDFDINEQDSRGHALLHAEILQGNFDGVRRLFRHDHLDLFLEDKLGRTPLDLAKRKKKEEIVRILEEEIARRECEKVISDQK